MAKKKKAKSELDDRMEAAEAYSKEKPRHFVDYCMACVEESEKSTAEVRDTWADTWDAYCNKMDFGDKEEWQSKVVTDKPFTSVQQAKTIIRKALASPDYFSITGINMAGKQAEPFIKAVMDYHLDEQRANFKMHASDATEMGFITGQSMEIIPQWDEYRGLTLTLTPPWHIFRDPDAVRRDPRSGMYWIHKERVDLWELYEEHRIGTYNANVKKVEDVGEYDSKNNSDNAKKGLIWNRSQYRKNAEVYEFWGVVLDHKGELLLPNATFTIAGEQLIRNPRVNPYVKIRWPGTSFSPFAHLLRFEGRGILEGVLTLWWLHNNMISLHADAANWAINRIREVDPSMAKFGTNLEIAPGSVIEKKSGAVNPVVTEVSSDAGNIDMMPFFTYYDGLWENGSFVNQFVAGAQGSRTDITKGEVEIKTQMSMGIFDSIGQDIEMGLVNALESIVETVILNWGGADIINTLGDKYPMESAMLGQMTRKEKVSFLKQNAIFRIQGISAQLKQGQMLERLQALMKRMESPLWSKYAKGYKTLQQFSKLIGFDDYELIASPEEAQKIDEIEAQTIANAASEGGAPPPGQTGSGGKPKPKNMSQTPREAGNPGAGDLNQPGF